MQRQLFVLRHAKSSWDDPGLDDHERPLAPLRQARRVHPPAWAALKAPAAAACCCNLSAEGIRMRRCLILFAAAACLVAGCGSSSSSSSNPLTTELSYLPSGSPLILTVATDPNGGAIKGVNALIGRFPLASIGVGALKSKLQQSGVNYDGDVRPLLGNPVALAVTGSSVSTHLTTNVLVVWVTKDADKLKSLVQKA